MFLNMIEAALWASYLLGPSVLSTQHESIPVESVIVSPWFDQVSPATPVNYMIPEATHGFVLKEPLPFQFGSDTFFEPTGDTHSPLSEQFERRRTLDALKLLMGKNTEETLLVDAAIQSPVLLAQWMGETTDVVNTELLWSETPFIQDAQTRFGIRQTIDRDRLPGDQCELVWTGKIFELRFFEYLPPNYRCGLSFPLFKTETIPLTVHSHESKLEFRPLKAKFHQPILIIIAPREMIVSCNSR